MAPPSRNTQRGGKRTSQKQQRELDAKLHHMLRTLMYPSYMDEEIARQSTFAEAQRIASGVPGRTLKEELDIECDLELEPAPRPRPEPIRRPEPAEPAIVATAPEEPSSVSPPPEPKSEFATEWNSSAEVLYRSRVTEQENDDEFLSETFVDNDELFDNEAKDNIQRGSILNYDVHAEQPEVDLDLEAEVTVEELKAMSLEDVCIRVAHCAHAYSTGAQVSHGSSWYSNAMSTCQLALTTHDYPRPHLPFEVERKLDKLCDEEEELFRAECERNAKKLERRSARFGADGGDAFECIYPVAKEELVQQPVLLTGVSGNVQMFFKLVAEKTHMIDAESCHPDCVCYSMITSRVNVLHLAAAHGNAKFITKVLLPDEDMLSQDDGIRTHYFKMVDRWISSTIGVNQSNMFPLDVAVYYDELESARALLASPRCAHAVRSRRFEMSSIHSSVPYRQYTESPLSIAAYHGNVEMVDLLKKHELLLPHHFPQAFREAAGAGDLPMLRKLWTLCGENHACLHESESERCRRRCTPLHVAAAAGHLTCVQHLCVDDYLRKTQDCVGDLPLNYAIENGHLVIAEFLIRMYADEVPHTVIRSALNCRRNKLAKMLFHIMMEMKTVIEAVKPMKVAVETGNFHMAEYILKQYMLNHKVSEKPWSEDIEEALQEVLRSNSLTTIQRAKFVVAFQMAGFKVSLVTVLKTVRDKSVSAFICNSLRHPSNKPK